MKRAFTIDLLKLLAAQAIVLHHLSIYGPMAELFNRLWPAQTELFTECSRLAVQVFLVMGGFLAAQALDPRAPQAPLLGRILRRYLRLIPPYLVALTCISLLVWCMRGHIDGDWLVDPPRWGSAIAHALTVQGLLDQPSLSAGVWYVAIDFQLYVLLVLVIAACQRPRMTAWAVLLLAMSSMWYFNHHPQLDNWPMYFFGSYGLGVLAGWRHRGIASGKLFGLALCSAVLAFCWAPRSRLAVASVTALVLLLSAHRPTPRNALGDWMRRLSDASYGTFLTHFGLIVTVSAIWHIEHFSGLPWALAFVAFTWILSVAIGMAFHRWVETPLGRWLGNLLPARGAAHRLPTVLP